MRYYGDLSQRIRSPRNRFLAAGNALLGRLRVSLDRHEVPVWLEAPLQELLREPVTGRVTGAILRRNNQDLRIEARLGVVLALRSLDMTAPMLLPGLRLHMDGLKDAYPVEGGIFQRWDASKQTYVNQGSIINLEGKAKLCAWDQASSSCK